MLMYVRVAQWLASRFIKYKAFSFLMCRRMNSARQIGICPFACRKQVNSLTCGYRVLRFWPTYIRLRRLHSPLNNIYSLQSHPRKLKNDRTTAEPNEAANVQTPTSFIHAEPNRVVIDYYYDNIHLIITNVYTVHLVE